jgi:hypothetical protein
MALNEPLPWWDANPWVEKGINLRLTEVQWAKLAFIRENTPLSTQKFIMSVLEPAIEEKLRKIVGAKRLEEDGV